MAFATAVPILFTSFVYCTDVYWSVIHGIKRNPHLSVVWNWYHFVAIAILHQPSPTDSADINTRMQLSDTNSIPPMYGGFLLLLHPIYYAMILYLDSNLDMQSCRFCLYHLHMCLLLWRRCIHQHGFHRSKRTLTRIYDSDVSKQPRLQHELCNRSDWAQGQHM